MVLYLDYETSALGVVVGTLGTDAFFRLSRTLVTLLLSTAAKVVGGTNNGRVRDTCDTHTSLNHSVQKQILF
jgi:hypothetical protein